MPRLHFLLAFTLAFTLCACAATTTQLVPKQQAPRVLPAVVTDATFPEVQRGFARLEAQAPERGGLRERLVGYLLAKGDEAIAADRYDDAVSRLAQISDLYSPAEFAARVWPEDLSRLGAYLASKGSPRGDEARVLSGMLIAKLCHPDDAGAAERYEKLSRWGFDARADMSGPLERFVGLVEAWEEHARLTPTPEVLATLVKLYVERRNALVKLFQSSEEQVPLSQSVFQGVQRTALSIAAVFLRHGDTASALAQVQALGGSGGLEQRLVEVLQSTREEGSEGAGAELDLSRAYLEGGRPDVARALCLSGLRSHRDDARFPQCLARIAATENDYGGALAWYADAIALVPEERALYDEILEVFKGLIDQGQLNAEASNTEALAQRATEIMQERMRRWPKPAPPVAPEDLYGAIGEAQMNAGHAREAEQSYNESLTTHASVPVRLHFGLLLERTGRPGEAVEQYKQALDSLDTDGPEIDRQRAELLERTGDALRVAGKRDEATRTYQKALALWDAQVAGLRARRVTIVELRRGVLLGRLSRANEAKQAFSRAMDAAPGARETYATILAYLAVSEPDVAFAHEVFRAAQNQAGLDAEWRVYFALWLRMITGRGGQVGQLGQALDADAAEVFKAFASGDSWPSKLARFGAGTIGYDKLTELAGSAGQRTEADFYEGARRLGAGDRAGANAMFTRVLQSQMVNFYEFAMAQELLALPVAVVPAAAPPSTAQAKP